MLLAWKDRGHAEGRFLHRLADLGAVEVLWRSEPEAEWHAFSSRRMGISALRVS